MIAGWSCLPAAIYALYYLPEEELENFNFSGFIAGGVIYALGAMTYALKFPEKQMPGVFDYIGNSHNIFHAACVVASLIHWHCNIQGFHGRILNPCAVEI